MNVLSTHRGYASISTLDYLQVDEVRQIDQDLSNLVISCLDKPQECMLRMVEDIPKLMEEYLK